MLAESNLPKTILRTEAPFKPSNWLNKIDFINHLVLFNNIFISIIADYGGGKTTFIELLKSTLDENITASMLPLSGPLTIDDLLSKLYHAFGLSQKNGLSLKDCFEQINKQKKHKLLIIDDAHYLSFDFIEELLLAIKSQGKHGFFHVCAVSDYSILANLNHLDNQVFAELIHTIEIGPLTEPETKTYLLRYLPSPKRLDKTMTEKRLAEFYDLTGGKIALINQHMIDFFNADALKPVSTPGKSKSARLAQFASVAVASIAACTLYFGPGQEQNVLTPAALLTAQTNRPAVIQPDTEDMTYSYIPEWTLASVNQVAQFYPKKQEKPEDEAFKDEQDLTRFVEMDRVVVIPKKIVKQASMVAKNATKPAELKLKSSLVSIQKLPAVIVKNVQTGIKPEQKAINVAKAGAKSHYTIQLIASPDENDLKRFMKKHPQVKNAMIYKTKRQGAVWYVLTYGQYNQKEEARLAMKQLAEFKPWIRTISTQGVIA